MSDLFTFTISTGMHYMRTIAKEEAVLPIDT